MSNVNKIKDSFPLIFDGAMGSYYKEVEKEPLPSCEMANIFQKERVKAIHREYLDAGAMAIKTNTFGANTVSLNCGKDIRNEIIKSGYKIALEEVNEKGHGFVFADIGPIPYNKDNEDSFVNTLNEYKEIVDEFISLGAKNFLFETLDEADIFIPVFQYIKSKDSDSFIICSFAVGVDGTSRKGINVKELLEKARGSKVVDALGLNCISGPGYMLSTAKRLDLPNLPLSFMPNSSYPTVVNNRIIYADNPKYFGKTVAEFLDLKASILGGCCGTTPAHIKELKKAVLNHQIAQNKEKNQKVEALEKIKTKETINTYYEKLKNGKKVIAVEIDPPMNIDVEKYLNNVKKLHDLGVDAITIADCPVGRARIDSSLMACKIKREIGIEPVVHLTCRDRNLNATKALLLGLNIENIRNLIVVTGDPIPSSDRDEIKPVFNFNSRLLSSYIRSLNNEIFTNKMFVGSGLNINANSFKSELYKAKKKEECGVEVFYTQPILSDRAVENLKIARSELKGKIMGGIIPIVSYRNAVFMNEEISGIKVDEDTIKDYKDLSKEEARALGIKISLEFMKKSEDLVDGFYLITPFNKVDIIEEIVKLYR